MRGGRIVLGACCVAVVGLAAFVMRPREVDKSRAQNRTAPEETGVPRDEKTEQRNLSRETGETGGGRTVEATSGGTSSLSLIGIVHSDAQATLSARLPARIVRVLVQEGQAVRRGQALVQLDDQDFVTQARTANAGVAVARTQVDKARAGRAAQKVKLDADVVAAMSGLKTAEHKLRQATLAHDAARDDQRAEAKLAVEGLTKAQIALKRAQQMLHGLEELDKVGGVSRMDLEGARAQVKVAQSDLATAREQVKRLEAGPGAGRAKQGTSYRVALAEKDVEAAEEGVLLAEAGIKTAQAARRQALAVANRDIQAVEAAWKQAQVGVEGALAAQRAMRLDSPIDGVVTSVGARAGETAQPGLPLITVVSLTGLRVDALVPARFLARMQRGQAARIVVDTRPGQAFPAIVSEIARVAEPDGRAFRVKFRFRNAVTLYPGQTARITVTNR